MEKIRLCFSELYNAGDLLNVDLVEMLSKKKVVRSKIYNADMIAIGGALFGLQFSGGARGLLQKGLGCVYGNKPLYVWGSGFLYENNERPLYRGNLFVCALRGEKTREKLSGLTHEDYRAVPLADAGLLVDMLLQGPQEKRYGIGVIPHFSQQGENVFSDICPDSDYHLIDIRNTPRRVAEEIAACELIVSSSLHGLVFADSLHVPSLRMIGETPLPGGTFKFEDYYSAYGVKDDPWVDTKRLPTAKDILARRCVDFSAVEEKKKALLKCFPQW